MRFVGAFSFSLHIFLVYATIFGIMDVVALWRSGYAAVCKTAYTGSIPVGTSIFVPKMSASELRKRHLQASFFGAVPSQGGIGTSIFFVPKF